MQELKPCPFCGATEELIEYGNYTGTMRGRAYVCCLECFAEITGSTVREAIAAWNRRANNAE